MKEVFYSGGMKSGEKQGKTKNIGKSVIQNINKMYCSLPHWKLLITGTVKYNIINNW